MVKSRSVEDAAEPRAGRAGTSRSPCLLRFLELNYYANSIPSLIKNKERGRADESGMEEAAWRSAGSAAIVRRCANLAGPAAPFL